MLKRKTFPMSSITRLQQQYRPRQQQQQPGAASVWCRERVSQHHNSSPTSAQQQSGSNPWLQQQTQESRDLTRNNNAVDVVVSSRERPRHVFTLRLPASDDPGLGAGLLLHLPRVPGLLVSGLLWPRPALCVPLQIQWRILHRMHKQIWSVV